MRIRFWGVRGSVPTPQPENMRYGGNTPCVEVRLNGRVYVFDCGTGFRNLGKQLNSEFAGRAIEAHIFISHFHWDHIQGIPFFAPLYDSAANRFYFHSSSLTSRFRTRSFREALEGQMSQPYFPVNMTEMAAHCEFNEIEPGRLELDSCTIESRWLNHPQGSLGFRLESPEGTLVYATDNEPGDPQLDKAVRKLAQGADVLIYDAQFLPDDYAANKRGWGHSHWREAIEVAKDSGASELVLFHHDPDHDDAAIDAIVHETSKFFPQVRAAAEGTEIALGEPGCAGGQV